MGVCNTSRVINIYMNNKSTESNSRWNWYGIEEEYIKEYTMSKAMIEFDDMYHTFIDGNRKCEVGKLDGVWGIRMWENQVWQEDRLIPGHSELYAENAAENYVLRVNS